MKTKPMFRYTFSLLMMLASAVALSQQASDTITYKDKYGLRIGVDLSKPVRSLLDDQYRGLELLGDYRVTENFYVAAELGNEKLTYDGDNISTFSTGSYIKLGADYNAYENWQDMQNMIFVGMRYGFSTFSQTLNSYAIYTSSNYYGDHIVEANEQTKGLNASWVELMGGIKVEVLNNLFLSLNVQLKRRISEKAPEEYDNLTIPGFGRTYDQSNFGAGYGYSISYMIPLYKKAHQASEKEQDETGN